MRPLIVELGRDFRGGQHQALLLLQGLRERGHSPELVAFTDSILGSRARNSGIRVHGVDRKRRRIAAAWTIRKLVRGGQADLVHANEPHALTAAWLARAQRHVPLVVSRRVTLPISRSPLALARYRAAARIIAVSDCVQKAVLAAGLPAARIAVIPDGVRLPDPFSPSDRTAARRKLAMEQDVVFLGSVAALTPDKGHALLLKALANLREKFPLCQLLIAGDGREREKLRALTRQLGLDAAVQFAGFVDDVAKVYEAIDLFVFPAQADGLGSALLAAMAHGLPVVAMKRGGVPEVVEDGKNGLLVGEPEPKLFAEAIGQLLAKPAEAQRMGQAARETIAARFSVARMVDDTLHLYERLIS